MKKLALIALLIGTVFSCHKPGGTSQRKIDNFGSGWQFTKDSVKGTWENVNLPHTAQVEPLVVNNQWQGDCWYKKEFDIKTSDNEKVFLYFEGVMHEADIWINGNLAAHHEGGYTPFTVDATQWVTNGKNTVTVKVNNQDNGQIPPGKPLKTLDFNYYGGIYRNVHLITTNKLYITDAVHANVTAGGGVLVHFNEASKNYASGIVKVHIKNEYDDDKTIKVKTAFKDADGVTKEFISDEVAIQSGKDTMVTQDIVIENPKLWGVAQPNMYDVEVNILEDGKTIDAYTTRTGIRDIELTDEGFFLNGEKMFINGTNRHQEYPYVGYAISDEAQYRDAFKIKSAGFDFVRMSHYPQSEAFMDACDELGLLVMNCISGWQFIGDEAFIKNSHQEIRDLARRDRNHPSVIIWEVSLNESEMDEGYMKKANEILRDELPFENIYTAGWMDNENYDLFIPARQHGKAPQYWNNYDKQGRKILIAEYGDWEYYAQNAGFNQTAFANLKEDERTSRQLRGAGEKALLQQAFNFQEAFNSNVKGEHTIGQANWLMFDYNRGYSDDIESSGISDIFRLPKFAYYFYQSQRNADAKPVKETQAGPMVHIASYWYENSATTVRVFSNCDEVALYLNDELIAKQTPTRNAFSEKLSHPPFEFNLPAFAKGTLRAEGYINGKKVTEHSVTTPGKAAKIELVADISGKAVNKDRPDTVFIYAKITDENGTVVHTSDMPVTFTVEGEDAELIGQNPMKAEAGIASILLRTEKVNAPIKIKASAPGIPEAEIEIK